MTVFCELVTDVRGIITAASPEAADVFAVDQRWLLRKPLATFVTSRDRREFRTLLLELETGRAKAATRLFAFETRASGEFAAELDATRRDGRISWRVAADVTAETRSRDVIDQPEEQLLHRVLMRLPQGVLIVDHNLRIVYVNAAARRLIGGRDGNRPGEALRDPWPNYALVDLVASLFTRKPAAGTHLVEVGERVICVEGVPAGHARTATLLLDDVTQRERARRAERQFIENAAHELRTPLAAILSVLEVLEDGAKEVPDARDRFLQHIGAHGQRLTRLANSLLVLARIQTGEQQPRIDLVQARPLLEEVAAVLVTPTAVALEVHASDEVGVLGDRDLLYHAVTNVAENAVKNTREGEIVLASHDLGRTTEIEVRDTGRGMTAEEKAHAFDRFYSSRSAPRGFGLGLAIAEEAVDAIGGNISIDSTRDVGTTVRIRLPSARIVA